MVHHWLLALLFLPALIVPLTAEDWTVLVYMAADNNLWQNAVQDVNDMESVALPANLNLIVQTDLPADSPYPGGQRRRIRNDSSPQITSPLLASLGSIDSGDPQTLKSFVNWGFQHYPSQRKMLVVWGHGDNWFKQEEPKWICPDEGAQSLISVAAGELREALSDIPHLDILLFDACSMQSVEVLAEVMNVADYVVGSAELVPAAGFPYQTIIPLFAAQSVEEIAALIPQKYLESYEPGGIQNPQGFTNPLTCSTVRTSQLPGFYDLFSDFFGVGAVGEAQAIVENIRGDLWEMNTAYCDVDLEEFMVSCGAMYPEPEVFYWINLTWGRWSDCVVWSGSANIPHVSVGSAAIWFPWHRQYFDTWWRQYRQLEFASTRWLSFLNRGLGDAVAPDAPTVSGSAVVLGTLQFCVNQPADPDLLTYQVSLYQGGSSEAQVFTYHPLVSTESFWVRLPVHAAGHVVVKCVDSCENVSDSTSFAYEYSEPELELLIAPNPVRDRSLASARWYLPEGSTGGIELCLYNIRGQKVLGKNFIQHEPGEGNWLFSSEPGFDRLARGTYILRIQVGKKWRQQKLTIL